MSSEIDQSVTVEQIVNSMGPEANDFLKVLSVVNAIVERPEDFHGAKALLEASRLAAYRTRIGVHAQHYKTAEKSIENRRRKDVMLTLYNALEENINTLKLMGRIDANAAGLIR